MNCGGIIRRSEIYLQSGMSNNNNPHKCTFIEHTDEFQVVLSFESKKTPAHPMDDSQCLIAERYAADMLAALNNK